MLMGVSWQAWSQGQGGSRRSQGNRYQSVSEQIWRQLDPEGRDDVGADDARSRVATWFSKMDYGGAGSITQNEFLNRFARVIDVSPFASRRRFGFSPNRYLGLFVVFDVNQDRRIDREEFDAVLHRILLDVTERGSNLLARRRFIEHFDQLIPKTNLTGIGQIQDSTRPDGIPDAPASPVYSARESMERTELVAGFHLELVAGEPLIEDPIALSFDPLGRLYVVELRSFMQDLHGAGEQEPISRISLLEDLDQDGRYERVSRFLNGLTLPRACLAIADGLLFVAQHQLYFARDVDRDGQADQVALIDPDYGRGSIEHAPNGLMLGLDNWIYNARSPYRYRRVGERWIRQETEFRGQWGVTRDNQGRLFFNINNSQLLGDITPPNYMGRNPNHPTRAGLNLYVATDQRVFPLRMNTAVNRGYLPDVLDAKGRLHVFASSCSPVIYRGNQYGADFLGNAFVCGPGANLVKRNLIHRHGLELSSAFAYPDREFLASRDERFRPVALANGPDGNLWMVDMYRGVIQQGLYMTKYLREESKRRSLDQGIHLGRIYRIVKSAGEPSRPVRLTDSSSETLARLLNHPNGWVRDQAQQLLIEQNDLGVIPVLLDEVWPSATEDGKLHVLWTLEGVGRVLVEMRAERPDEEGAGDRCLRLPEGGEVLLVGRPSGQWERVFEFVLAQIRSKPPGVSCAAIRVAELMARGNTERQILLLNRLHQQAEAFDEESRFQAILSAGSLPKPAVFSVIFSLLEKGVHEALAREAALSGLHGWELSFLQAIAGDARWSQPGPGLRTMVHGLAAAVIREGDSTKVALLLAFLADRQSRDSWMVGSLLSGIQNGLTDDGGERMNLGDIAANWEGMLSRASHAEKEQLSAIKAGLSGAAGEGREGRDVEGGNSGASTSLDDNEGETLYVSICAGCHGLKGEGVRPMAPPLARSEWVTEKPEWLIQIMLHGMRGPVEVGGRSYQVPDILPEMPPLSALSDRQIAIVASFVRNRWGNEGDRVTSDAVAAQRQNTAEKDFPWTAPELRSMR